jgi:hypothetical protein
MSEAAQTGESKPSEHGASCPRCEHLNPPAKEHCERCGARLFVECHHCKHLNRRVLTHCEKCQGRLRRGLFHRARRRRRHHSHHASGRQRTGKTVVPVALGSAGLLLALALLYLVRRWF